MIILGDIAHPFAQAPVWVKAPPPWASQPVVVNLEGPVVHDLSWTGQRVLFNHASIIDGLGQQSVAVACLANNHAFDLPDGFASPRKALAQANIAWVGAGDTIEEASKPVVLDVDGHKHAILAFGWSTIQCQPATGARSGVNPLAYAHVIATVSETRSRHTDAFLVVLFHWNYEMEAYPQPAHRVLARQVLEAGADAVVAHHPHRVAGLEFFDGKPVAYSIGNWWLPQRAFWGGKLAYGSASHLQLALEVARGREPACHWFRYDPQAHRLVHLSSEAAAGSERIAGLTPFAGMGDRAYEQWFAANRHKRRFLPIYRRPDDRFGNALRDRYVEARHYGLVLLESSGLRSLLKL